MCNRNKTRQQQEPEETGGPVNKLRCHNARQSRIHTVAISVGGSQSDAMWCGYQRLNKCTMQKAPNASKVFWFEFGFASQMQGMLEVIILCWGVKVWKGLSFSLFWRCHFVWQVQDFFWFSSAFSWQAQKFGLMTAHRLYYNYWRGSPK